MTNPNQLYNTALDYFGEGKLEEAAKAMEDLIQSHPDFLNAYEGLAMVYSRANRHDDAIRVMKDLAKLDSENPMVHANLSLFYMKKGMIKEAEDEKAKATILQFAKKKPKT